MYKILRKVITIASIGLLTIQTSFSQEKEEAKITLITNVKVWTAEGKDVIDADILIENNLIKEIKKGIKAPDGANIVDGKGGTVTPGLIDCHTHIMLNGPGGFYTGQGDYDAFAIGAWAYRDMNMLLDQGFTSVRDIAGNSLSIAKATRLGVMRGPRVWSAGPAFSSTGGHTDSGNWNEGLNESNPAALNMNMPLADGVDGVIKQSRWNFRHGAAFSKIMVGGGVASDFDPLEIIEYTPAELKAIVDIAADNKTYATIHAYRDDAVNRALDAGVKCIEHGFMLSEETLKRMKKEDVTLSLQTYMSVVGFATPEAVPWFSPEQVRKAKAVNAGAIKMIAMAKELDLTIVSGGDMFAEMTPLAKKNITQEKQFGWEPWEILQHATINAGKLLAMSGPARSPYREGALGVLKKGAYADLIVWEKSPLEDIENIMPNENIKVLIQDGEVLKNTIQ